jgi:hypothetical protein
MIAYPIAALAAAELFFPLKAIDIHSDLLSLLQALLIIHRYMDASVKSGLSRFFGYGPKGGETSCFKPDQPDRIIRFPNM